MSRSGVRAWIDGQATDSGPVVDYILRLEQANEALRRRNGQLYGALDQASQERMTPIADFPTMFETTGRVISAAVEFARTGSAMAHEALLEAVDLNENYWEHVAREKERRKAAARKRSKGGQT